MKINDVLQIRRTATAVKRSSVLLKASSIVMVGLILIVSVTYLFSYFFDRYSNFTVKVNRYDMINQGISLNETGEFSHPVSRLYADSINNLYNISVKDLPENLANDGTGDHSGKNYIAYTFFLKNTGKSTVTYHSSINLSGVTKGLDEAIRIRLYTNGEYIDYAKIKKDKSGPELGTVPFASETVAMDKIRRDFAPNNIDKFTVVIWLEGDDSDCVDSIIGGKLKAEMNFEIIEGS